MKEGHRGAGLFFTGVRFKEPPGWSEEVNVKKVEPYQLFFALTTFF